MLNFAQMWGLIWITDWSVRGIKQWVCVGLLLFFQSLIQSTEMIAKIQIQIALDLRNNFKTLLFQIQNKQREVTCDICCQAKAVKTCLTCNVSYCEYDARQHYTVKALERHTMSDVCGEVEGKRCHHNQKSLDFFCRTDQMQICCICVERKHKGHDIILQKTQHAAEQVHCLRVQIAKYGSNMKDFVYF